MEEKLLQNQYTKEDILQALLRMNEEQRNGLLAYKFQDIERFANNENGTSRKETLNYLDAYIQYIESVKQGLLCFVEILETEPDIHETMEDMLSKYERFNTDQKLEFNVKLDSKNTLLDSLNYFHYNWKKLTQKVTD